MHMEAGINEDAGCVLPPTGDFQLAVDRRAVVLCAPPSWLFPPSHDASADADAIAW